MSPLHFQYSFSVCYRALLWFYPHFSISLAYMPSVPMLSTHMLLSCASRSWDLSLLTSCTYMHDPLCPPPYLVPYGCAMASYHVSLTHLLMTHSSPLVLYTFPIWYASWSPSTSQIQYNKSIVGRWVDKHTLRNVKVAWSIIEGPRACQCIKWLYNLSI